MYAPPKWHVWHEAFFGGSRRKAGAHTRPAFPKMLKAPSAFPLLGAPQVPGNKSPTEGRKKWGEGFLRPKEISKYRDTLGQIRAADNPVKCFYYKQSTRI